MKSLLITGGRGFIARNLAEELAGRYRIAAPGRQELDLVDEDAVLAYLEANRFDAVLHCAAHNGSRNPTGDLGFVLQNNLRMYFNLLRGSRHFDKLIYFGTGAEYDMRHYRPLMGEDYFGIHVPVDDTGFSRYIMQKHAELARNVVNLRVFGLFGKHEDWEIRFISNACCKALHGLPITLRQNIRFDYLWIDDLVRITEWFIENQPRRVDYNVCTSNAIDLVSLARKVRDISSGKPEIRVGKPGFKAEYSGSNARLLEAMGGFDFTPRDAAIATLYRWYESRLYAIDKAKLQVDK